MAYNILSTSALLICAVIQFVPAQTFLLNPHKFGQNIAAGGIDQPRFQFVDIDNDADPDLFILDRDERLWFYRSINGSHRLEPNTSFGLTTGSWFRFVDIDHDGDKDCFTNGSFSEVSLHTNTGTASSPQFQLTTAALRDTAGTEIFSDRFSIPTFADIDGDGDDDFFTGGQSGSIAFYKNVGTPGVPAFAYITDKFNGIEIIGGGAPFSKAMHGASGIEFYDADSNGVLDLFWGDYFNRSLYYLHNNGTKQNANIVLVDSTYPDDDAVFSNGFNIPQHVDMDADGAVDIMAASVFPTAEYDNFFFYKNFGSNAGPLYLMQTKNFLPMIDAGSRSTAAAADFDNDGDLDLAVSSALGKVQIHTNIGTSSAPVFQHIPSHSFFLESTFYGTVCSGDINGDGKQDLMFGNLDGGIRTYANTGSAGTFAFTKIAYALDQFDAGQSSAPFIIDMDGNGVNDVLVGSSGGLVQLLMNTGTNAVPVFVPDTAFTLIDAGNDAIPSAADINSDGTLDLLVGNLNGTLFHYTRIPSTVNKFQLVTDKYRNIALNTQSAPCIADMDNDGDNDLLLGNGKGGIFFYEQISSAFVNDRTSVIPEGIHLEQNFPNPFNPSTTITYSIPSAAHVLLTITDLLGRTVETLTNVEMKSGKHSVVWNATNASSGTYFIRLSVTKPSSGASIYKRISLIK